MASEVGCSGSASSHSEAVVSCTGEHGTCLGDEVWSVVECAGVDWHSEALPCPPAFAQGSAVVHCCCGLTGDDAVDFCTR